MSDLIAEAVQRLRDVGVDLGHGLDEEEIAQTEARFGFSFGFEHRAFLSVAMPIGERWVDWRRGSEEDIQARLDRPVDGVIFDVRENDFWPRSWGQRPADSSDAERVARDRMSQVPRLIPLYSHRYLPADPAPVPSPVLSVYQTDVIYYGENIVDYVAREFESLDWHQSQGAQHVGFWSALAEGAEDTEL